MQSNQELVTLENPSTTHLDIISDIVVVQSIQVIASSSQDGVLKLWKKLISTDDIILNHTEEHL